MPRKKLSHKESYRSRMRDCSTDTAGGPIGAIGTLDSCYYKVARNKAWRWNRAERDWVISTKTAAYIIKLFSAKSDKENKSNGV